MKTINIQIGEHFIKRFQERYHVSADDVLNSINTHLNEGNLNIHKTDLFFPLIGGIVPLGKNLYNREHFFAMTITYAIPDKYFTMGNKYKRKIIWYINPLSDNI